MSAPPALPTFEREVMEQVWALGPASGRSVLQALNAASSRPRAYTTIVTVLQRLEAKGMLARTRGPRHDVYAPTMSHAEYLRARADAEVDEVIAQYGELALMQFARRAAALDPERRAALRRLGEP